MLAPVIRFLRRLHRPAGLGLAALGVTVVLALAYSLESRRGSATPLLKGETAFRNLLVQEGRRSAPRTDLVLLGYDQTSLTLEGAWPEDIEASLVLRAIAGTQAHWPWPRSVQTAILERLIRAGAKTVVFDVVFAGPSPDDEQFRAALDRNRDKVVIGANINLLGNASVLLAPTLIPIDDRVGYVEYVPGRSGEVFALSFHRSAGDLKRVASSAVYDSLVDCALEKSGHADLIPANSVDQLYPFRFSRRFTARPVYEIFLEPYWKSNYHDGADFKDKIVVIGPTASILHDFHATPLGSIPGPEVHVHALAAALNRDYLRVTSPAEDLLLILAAGLIAWVVGVKVRPPLPRAGILLLAGGGYVVATLQAYNRLGWQLTAFTPLLTLYTGGFGGLVGEYVIERAEKARVRGVLDRLVSKDIVRELLEDRESYAQIVRGQRRTVTVLFSDVRGFTTLSEAAGDPAVFIAQLNEYLAEMVDVVFKHRGTLDKFIGDSVMAVWGSMHTEGPDADARAAVAAALEMRERLAALNVRWAAVGKLRIDIGIGLNHGEVIVGGLGSEKSKMEITVMGDAVNLASRLEGLTKDYGLDLLVGESVARLVSDAFRLRTVDLVRVKGKTRPSEVMAVIGPLTAVPSEAQEYLFADYEDAILLYRKREFAAAARILEDCLKAEPTDQLAALYLERCRTLLADAPTAGWDGVRKMTTK